MNALHGHAIPLRQRLVTVPCLQANVQQHPVRGLRVIIFFFDYINRTEVPQDGKKRRRSTVYSIAGRAQDTP